MLYKCKPWEREEAMDNNNAVLGTIRDSVKDNSFENFGNYSYKAVSFYFPSKN